MPDPLLVSVIIPAYNAGQFIEETLASVFRQTCANLEVIVVDDGSTDDTKSRLQAYGSRIHYIWQPNAGVGAARNRGMQAASGEYLAFLDADDLWNPEKLQVQLAVAARNPNSGLIACDGVRLYGNDVRPESLLFGPVAERMRTLHLEEITGDFYREFIRAVPIFCPSQMLVPRSVATRVGPMSTVRDDAEDWDYTLRIAMRFPVTLHRHSLVAWRVHSQSRSGALERRQIEWALWKIKVLKRHRKLCPLEDRALIAERLLGEIRRAALGAYSEGRSGNKAFARRILRRLVLQTPWNFRGWIAFIALECPHRIVSYLARRVPYLARRVPPATGEFAGKQKEPM